MATRRWLGRAVDIKQVDTVTIADTWAQNDTITLTIDNLDVVVTIGTLVTTAQVATTLKQAFNGEALTDTAASVSPTIAQSGAQAIAQFAEIVATVSSSVVTLTARTAGAPFTLSVTESTAGDGTATEATATAATGKHHWDNQDNWSGNTVPIDNDDVVFDDGAVDLKYALTAAIQPATFTRTQGYTGQIGLLDTNRDNPSATYPEYRTKALTFDDNSVTCTYDLGIGSGSGGRTRLDAGAGQSTVNVYGTGQRGFETSVPALLFIGSHASNEVNVARGDVGIAFYDGETAVVATLRVGYTTNPNSDSQVIVGDGVTLTTVTKTGGVLETRSGLTTGTNENGDWTHREGAITTLTVQGGACYYNSTGTLTTGNVSGSGLLDFSRDPRAKTVTNPVEVFGPNARFRNPHKVIGSLVVDLNQTALSSNIELGTNIRITLGTPS